MEQHLEIKNYLNLDGIISQVNSILSQPKDRETDDDINFQYLIRIIFNIEPDSNEIVSLKRREARKKKLII